VQLLTKISTQLGVALQQSDYLEQARKQSLEEAKTAERERAVNRVISKLRASLDIETIFTTTTQEVRVLLNIDRVTIYKFREDYFGDFVTESESGGWPKLVGSGWEDPFLSEHKGGRFHNNEPLVVDDVYNAGLTDCHVEALEYFGVKACIVVSIFQGEKLWGLLSAFQNSAPRHWEEGEVKLLTQIGTQLGVALQQAEYLQQTKEQSAQIVKTIQREKAQAKIIDRLRHMVGRNTSDIIEIFHTVTQEIRNFLKCDRVALYRFLPDWSGEFIVESVGKGWVPLVDFKKTTVWADTYLQDTQGGRYAQGESFAVDDISQSGHANCHLEILEQFEVKAYAIAPIFFGETLWGLLGVYQNSDVRHWEEGEIGCVTQIASQLGVAIQQSDYVKQLEDITNQMTKAAKREKAVTKTIAKILQAPDTNSIYRIATQEVRLLLKCDRVAIYRFNPDWSGEFIYETVSKGWISVVGPDTKTVWADTYLQDNQGGRYRHRESFAVNDIYQAGFATCHLEILEQFEAKAYIIAPIFVGETLWGLLGVYQNNEPRHWEEGEITAVTQIGVQIGGTLQQINYLEQVQQKSEQLTRLAQRESNFISLIYKTGQRITERLQQKALNPDSLFRATTQELRQLLKCDRVIVYRFLSDWTGEIVAEDVGSGYVKLVGTEAAKVADPVLQETKGGKFRKNEYSAVSDITQSNDLTFSKELLEQWGAKAYMIAPLNEGDRLWGLLAIYQNGETRVWDEGEINLLVQMATQLGIVLQQAEYLEQIEQQSQQLAQAADREKADKESLQRNVVQLLSAVRPALLGDLTVRAPITDDEVGTIADAYNNTLQSLRGIVTQVQQSSRKVAQTSKNSDAAIAHLTTQAQQQFQALQQAFEQIESMVEFTEAVGTSAQQVEAAVQKANQTVRQGDAAMNRTVDGILDIRETVAETSKKIKRLSESSQKVSRVVSLISNFTTQTQLLALNAAIEATRAGEYGRGFVVVADEVRSLARQSADATTEIAQLVQEIQEGTAEVSAVMEKGIQQVAQGTNLVTDARQSLNAIVEATTQISSLVEAIAKGTQVQTQHFQSVTQTMTDVAAISNKTSEDSIEISTSFKELLAMAENLQASADQFKVD
jgi:methyl-accepting chemotaxis protein PixJ